MPGRKVKGRKKPADKQKRPGWLARLFGRKKKPAKPAELKRRYDPFDDIPPP